MKQNWIRLKPLSFNWWRLVDRFSRLIIKRRIKVIDDFFVKRSFDENNKFSICYAETLRDYYDPYPRFYDGPIEEKEILKEQIIHLDRIIEILEDCKKREIDLEAARTERGCLKGNLGYLEKITKKEKLYD